jgi:ATP-dependent Clp protease protease subunit
MPMNTVNSTTEVASPELIKLTNDNFVVIRGSINGESASRAINELVNKKSKNLYLFISSNGGSVSAGLNIIQSMKALELSGVTITCIGNVALSMGFVIMQYCSNRVILPSSVLMQHQMSLGLDGPINNINSYMRFVTSMNTRVDTHQSNRMNMSLDNFRKLTEHDLWLFGSEAIDYKAADRLAYVTCDFKSDTYKETIYTMFGEVTLEFSTCPLSTNPLKIIFGKNISNEHMNNILDEVDMSRYIEKLMKIKNTF